MATGLIDSNTGISKHKADLSWKTNPRYGAIGMSMANTDPLGLSPADPFSADNFMPANTLEKAASGVVAGNGGTTVGAYAKDGVFNTQQMYGTNTLGANGVDLKTGGILGFGQDASRLNALSNRDFAASMADQGIDINSLDGAALDAHVSAFNKANPKSGGLGDAFTFDNAIGLGNLVLGGLSYANAKAYNDQMIAASKANVATQQQENAAIKKYRDSYTYNPATDKGPSVAKKDKVG